MARPKARLLSGFSESGPFFDLSAAGVQVTEHRGLSGLNKGSNFLLVYLVFSYIYICTHMYIYT